jgi:hypothetical protein
MIRRLTAIATWVLLLHLNLVASDLVCAKHHEPLGGAMTSAMQHHAPSHLAMGVALSNSDGQSCRVPARADCCRVMASCGVSVGLRTSALDVPPPIVRASVAATTGDTPTSFAFAPETPPPKA